jgi:hypothetical protein
MNKKILMVLAPALLAPFVLGGSRQGCSLKWLALLLAPLAIHFLMEDDKKATV